MTYAAAAFGILSFVAALQMFRIVEVAAGAVEVSRGAARSMYDPSLTDEDRERALQRAALSLLGTFVSILVRGGAALGVSVAVIFIFHVLGLVRFAEVMNLLQTWEAIVGASVFMTFGYFVWMRR